MSISNTTAEPGTCTPETAKNVPPVAVVPDAGGEAWHARADDLAAWAMERLVNRTDRYGGYTDKGPKTKPEAGPKEGRVTHNLLARHFRAVSRSCVLGLHSLGTDGMGRWAGWDIDAHKDDDDPDRNRRYALHLFDRLTAAGLRPLLVDSSGTGGYHVWVMFAAPVSGPVLHRFARWAVADHAGFGFAEPPEANPKQERSDRDKYASWLRVPGRHHKREWWSRVWSGSEWVGGGAGVDIILSHAGDDPALIPPESQAEVERRVSAVRPAPLPSPAYRAAGGNGGTRPAGCRIGDWYDRTADWRALLAADGASLVSDRGDESHWCRPGKTGATSATLGHLVSGQGVPKLRVFTSNWPGLEQGRSYTPFEFRAAKQYGYVNETTLRDMAAELVRSGEVPEEEAADDIDISAFIATTRAEAAATKALPGQTAAVPAAAKAKADTSTADLLAKLLADIKSGVPPVRYKLPSPFEQLDVRPGDLILAGGAPGVGKTALFLQVGIDMLRMNDGVRLLIANVEMSKESLLRRILSRASKVPHKNIRNHDVTPEMLDRLKGAADCLSPLMDRMKFLDPPFSVEHVEDATDAFGANVVIADYLQRFRAGKGQTEKRDQIDSVVDGLRRLCLTKNITVLAASALSRQKDDAGRSGYTNLNIASYRGSSDLEYGCNQGFVLYGVGGNEVRLENTKARDDELVHFRLKFNGAVQWFTAAERDDIDVSRFATTTRKEAEQERADATAGDVAGGAA